MASFSFERQVAAPPETVFEVFTDHRGYADITRLRRAELEKEGDPDPNGTGAIRALHLLGPPMREEVLTYEPPRRFSYRVLSGLPVRDHVGTVELDQADGGTKVTYAVRLIPTVPVLGFAVVAAIRRGVAELVEGAAAEAERRARAAHA